MKLLMIMDGDGNGRLGIRLEAGGVLDVAGARAIQPEAGSAPVEIMEAIGGGPEALERLKRLASDAESRPETFASALLAEEEIRFGPCVTSPGKIVCVGLNYRKHALESGLAIPEQPLLFNKFGNTLAAHGERIPIPDQVTSQADYEAELAIVIGKTAKNVDKEQALDYVFGYCCANDLSARDLQLRTSQWLLGKTLDKFCPLGPYLVTADEVGDPNDLAIGSTLNGEVRQRSHTSDMVFRCDEIVSYVSRHMTLSPGDILLTGTPEGVILGYPEERREWLKPGDTVTVEIEKLGALTNIME
ncbi:fumarylacetoacetate hydrolase family protein [Paenibacillaceae bacterium WGS1546]|uniref:fumarylacetoacetate hydrolase family protein n=1 Tax=Cohnella sp. WGS1546 TaxID=3366810 RepID=UPI00372D199E